MCTEIAMGCPRSVLVLTCFGILSSISIYWSFLQTAISDFKNVQMEDGYKLSYLKRPIPLKYYLNTEKPLPLNKATIKSSHCAECNSTIKSEADNNETKVSIIVPHKRQIWISMGLCFSGNTEMYDKRYYPYTQVTPLAIILWYHFFPQIRVILYLIYNKYEIDDRRKLYEESLKQTNVEIRWVRDDGMNCVTKSQLARMWAFQESLIASDDIIVTVDVNLFVATTKILDPIHEHPNLKLWVFQWHRSAFVETGIGETFNQNLIAAESKGI